MHSIPNIPDYQISADDFLGEGAYGCVWRAVFKGDQERAVKVFKPRAIQEMLFEVEYDKLRQLDEHPGIVTLYDRGRTDASEPYFVMRLMAEKHGGRWVGRTLASRLAATGEAPDAKLRWRWTLQVAEAVAFMHERDIVHCDLKPSNVLLSSADSPDAVVTDFGQSRSSSLHELPAPGSLAFASPEQLENPERSNPRWDVYGFASTIFYLWYSRPPRPLSDEDGDKLDPGELVTLTEALEPDEQLAKLVRQVREQDEVIAPGGGDMPAGLFELLQRCLSIDPEGRPANMGEVLAELRLIEARSRRGFPVWLMATLGVALIAAVATAVVYSGKLREQRRLEKTEAAKSELREQLENAGDDDPRARHEIAVRLLEYEPENALLMVARYQSLADMRQWERLAKALSDAPEQVMKRPDMLPVKARLARAEDDRKAELDFWYLLAATDDIPADLRRQGYREWCSLLLNEQNWPRLHDAASDWLAWEVGIDPFLFRVRASLNLRDFKRARSDLDAARGLDATDDRVRNLTPLVERGERLADALVQLDAAVAAAGRDPKPLLERALAFVEAGFTGLSKADIDAAQRLAPASMAVRILKEVVLYIETGRRVADSLVTVDGNRWRTYDQQHLESIERDGPMLRDLLAMEFDQSQPSFSPSDFDIGRRARKLSELGQHRLAIELAKPQAQRDGSTLDVWFPLLAACLQGGFWSEGEALAREATERFDQANGTWFFLGALRARQSDHRGAVDALTRSLELFEDPNALDWRATSYQALGDQARANQDRLRLEQLKQNPN